MNLPVHKWAIKADAFAHKKSVQVGLGRPYVKARSVAKRLRNRVGLLRLVITGQAPFLMDMENDWFVTKNQMLMAHEVLSKDILTLRDRVESVAKQMGQVAIIDSRRRPIKKNAEVIQVDKDMPTELKPDV